MTDQCDKDIEPSLLFDRQAGVATLTLNRPATRNALTTGLFLEMERVLLEVEADDAVRAVVLTGAGRGFSAGGDFKPVSEGTKDPLGHFEKTMDGVSEQAGERLYSKNLAEMMGSGQ